jgi:hypothetical protein
MIDVQSIFPKRERLNWNLTEEVFRFDRSFSRSILLYEKSKYIKCSMNKAIFLMYAESHRVVVFLMTGNDWL